MPRLRCNLDLRNCPEDNSQRVLNAIEPGTVMPIHRHRTTYETVVFLWGRVMEEFFDESSYTCTALTMLRQAPRHSCRRKGGTEGTVVAGVGFVLAVGVGSGEDGLYKFKAAFNKNSDYQFSIGKKVFNQEKYDELVKIRRESDAGFDEGSCYFPLYRA